MWSIDPWWGWGSYLLEGEKRRWLARAYFGNYAKFRSHQCDGKGGFGGGEEDPLEVVSPPKHIFGYLSRKGSHLSNGRELALKDFTSLIKRTDDLCEKTARLLAWFEDLSVTREVLIQ